MGIKLWYNVYLNKLNISKSMVNFTRTYRSIPYLDDSVNARILTANRVRQEDSFKQDIIAQREDYVHLVTGSLMNIYPFRHLARRAIRSGFNDGFEYNMDQTSIRELYPPHTQKKYDRATISKQASLASFFLVLTVMTILGLTGGLIVYALGAATLVQGTLIGLASGAGLGIISGGVIGAYTHSKYEKYNNLGIDHGRKVAAKAIEQTKQILQEAEERTYGRTKEANPPKEKEEPKRPEKEKEDKPTPPVIDPPKVGSARREEIHRNAQDRAWSQDFSYRQPGYLYSHNPHLCPQPQYVVPQGHHFLHGQYSPYHQGHLPYGQHLHHHRHQGYFPYEPSGHMPYYGGQQSYPVCRQAPLPYAGYQGYMPYEPPGHLPYYGGHRGHPFYGQEQYLPQVPYLPHAECLPQGPYACPHNQYFGMSPFAHRMSMNTGYHPVFHPPFGPYYDCIASPVSYGIDGVEIVQDILQTDVGGNPSYKERVMDDVRNGAAYGANRFERNTVYPYGGRGY